MIERMRCLVILCLDLHQTRITLFTTISIFRNINTVAGMLIQFRHRLWELGFLDADHNFNSQASLVSLGMQLLPGTT